VVGADEVLPAFEQAMMGKEVGDTFEISLSVEDAYGEEDEEAFVELPKSAFMVDGEIDESLFEVGEVVPMETEDGDEVIGIIDEVRLNSVVVDFNHPYAGMNLHFVGKVTLIENAPPQAN
jgi:FKBP-type peptidyl-prolyl cis-trans isomerase SlyD